MSSNAPPGAKLPRSPLSSIVYWNSEKYSLPSAALQYLQSSGLKARTSQGPAATRLSYAEGYTPSEHGRMAFQIEQVTR